MTTVDALEMRYGRASECTSCSAPVRWAITAKGKRMPIDAEPAANGNCVLRVGGQGEPLRVDVFGSREAALAATAEEQTFTSHMATCPYRRRHGAH